MVGRFFMELIVKKPCPDPKKRPIDLEQGIQVGRNAHVRNILFFLQMEPNRLYTFAVLEDPDPIQTAILRFLHRSKKQTVRNLLRTRHVDPDAFIYRPGKKHPRVGAFWGATLQNALPDGSFVRGILAMKILDIYHGLKTQKARQKFIRRLGLNQANHWVALFFRALKQGLNLS